MTLEATRVPSRSKTAAISRSAAGTIGGRVRADVRRPAVALRMVPVIAGQWIFWMYSSQSTTAASKPCSTCRCAGSARCSASSLAEVIYTDAKLLALHRALPAHRQVEHGFDAAVVDWELYIQKIHCPAITGTMRKATAGRRSTARTLPPIVPTDDRTVAAVFD